VTRLVKEMDQREQRMFKFLVNLSQESERRLLQAISASISASEQRLTAQLAQHTKSSADELSTRVNVVDKKYQDLPDRVKRLEDKVFPDE